MYSSGHMGAVFALKHSFMLGKWHPFKEFAHLVWRKFLHLNIASSFFSLFPTATCYSKPKLTSVLSIFGYHQRAYPLFAEHLHTSYQNAILLRSPFVEDLRNLIDFYEIYVPTV